MDPEALRILKRVDRYLNLLRAIVLFNVVLTVLLLLAAIGGLLYVKQQLESANRRIDSQVEDLKAKLPATNTFRLR